MSWNGLCIRLVHLCQPPTVTAILKPQPTTAQTADYLVINKPTKNENIPAGSQYKVTWEPNEKYPGKVNIAVLEGADPATLQPGPNVTTESTSSDPSLVLVIPRLRWPDFAHRRC